MAACSERERILAIQVLEDLGRTSGLGFHGVMDAAFEELRHTLIEVWSRVDEDACHVLAPFLDLLTTLHCDGDRAVQTAVFRPGCLSLRDAIRGIPESGFDFGRRPLWLISLVPRFGGARESLRRILAAAGCPEDRTCRV